MDAALKALVIDDDPDIVNILGCTLEKAGIRTLTAHEALEGLAVARREHPAVILMDVQMPGMNGALMAALLKESEGVQDIPVILISSMPEEELEKKAREARATSFLPKPLSLERVVAEIRRCVEKPAAVEVER